MTDVRGRLARYRVRLGFVAAGAALWLAQPTRQSLLAGAAVAAIGEAIRVWAAGHLDKGREVTASGPYRYMRHPLYVGSAIIGAGFAIASHSLVAALVVAVYLMVTIAAAIRSEEHDLTQKFGAIYPEYREGRVVAPPRHFSLSRAIANREYRALTGLLAALALLGWKAL